MKPKKIPHDSQGLCENCGKPLGKTAWRYGESTGCSKKCVIAVEEIENGDTFSSLGLSDPDAEMEREVLFEMAELSTRGW